MQHLPINNALESKWIEWHAKNSPSITQWEFETSEIAYDNGEHVRIHCKVCGTLHNVYKRPGSSLYDFYNFTSKHCKGVKHRNKAAQLISDTKNVMMGRKCPKNPTEIPSQWVPIFKGINKHHSVAKIVIEDSLCEKQNCCEHGNESWFHIEYLVCHETHISLGGARNSDGLGLRLWRQHESTAKHQNILHGPAPGTEAGQRMRVKGSVSMCHGYFRETVQFTGVSGATDCTKLEAHAFDEVVELWPAQILLHGHWWQADNRFYFHQIYSCVKIISNLTIHLCWTFMFYAYLWNMMLDSCICGVKLRCSW